MLMIMQMPPADSNFDHSTKSSYVIRSCLICQRNDADGLLHAISTFQVDSRVSCCVHALQDSRLIAKPSAEELIATEAVLSCLLFCVYTAMLKQWKW
jgi:hypothetical protein